MTTETLNNFTAALKDVVDYQTESQHLQRDHDDKLRDLVNYVTNPKGR